MVFRKFLIRSLLFGLLLCAPMASKAGMGGAGGGIGMGMGTPPCGNPSPLSPPCPIPLDGGIALLGAAGAFLASRRLFKKD